MKLRIEPAVSYAPRRGERPVQRFNSIHRLTAVGFHLCERGHDWPVTTMFRAATLGRIYGVARASAVGAAIAGWHIQQRMTN